MLATLFARFRIMLRIILYIIVSPCNNKQNSSITKKTFIRSRRIFLLYYWHYNFILSPHRYLLICDTGNLTKPLELNIIILYSAVAWVDKFILKLFVYTFIRLWNRVMILLKFQIYIIYNMVFKWCHKYI